MKVYLDDCGARTLIGRADIPEDEGPSFEVPLFGPSSVIIDRFTIAVVTHLPPDGRAPKTERAVLISPGQSPDLLPGWQPLAS
jgi:hypothetical protein